MSKRQADAFENDVAEAKKKRNEPGEECSSLKAERAALRKKVAALEKANKVHIEETKDLRIRLTDSQDDVEYYRARAEHMKADNDLLKSEGQVVNVSNRQVAVIPDLSRFSKLDALYMRSNLLNAISDKLPRTLVTLCLCNNKIEEIRGLDALVNLEDLFLSENRLRKIQGLSDLVNLRLLTLDNNKISRIEGLDGLRDLRHLDLSNNEIRTIQNMDRLTNLESLFISDNPIRKLENLGTLTRLTKLLMNALAIESFDGIQKLVNLTTLHANGNAITSLDYLEQLRCLKLILVKDNKISHASEVEKLSKLPSLKTIVLKGNPIEPQRFVRTRR